MKCEKRCIKNHICRCSFQLQLISADRNTVEIVKETHYLGGHKTYSVIYVCSIKSVHRFVRLLGFRPFFLFSLFISMNCSSVSSSFSFLSLLSSVSFPSSYSSVRESFFARGKLKKKSFQNDKFAHTSQATYWAVKIKKSLNCFLHELLDIREIRPYKLFAKFLDSRQTVWCRLFLTVSIWSLIYIST